MQAQVKVQTTRPGEFNQQIPYYVSTTAEERRRGSRQQKETEMVRHFTPGRIPVVRRMPMTEHATRVLDILGATVGLLIFAPVLVLSMIAIKLTSRGSIFYTQIRVGEGGRLFRMYKLRTMVNRAEKLQKDLLSLNEMEGPVFKIKNDPRITAVGAILRKYSIDEVPQFINVLKGEMSLVGPRPPLAKEVKRYHRWHLQRLMVRPGMTGLWQVSGRNRINFDEWVRLDIRYIRQRTVWFDLKIMLQTFKVVFVKPDGT